MNNEELEIEIENLRTTVHENNVLIADMSESIEEFHLILENLKIDKIIEAITDLQNEVSDLAGKPVGLLFDRIRRNA